MKKIFLATIIIVATPLISEISEANQMRVYCKPDGVIFEQVEGEYTEDNKIFDYEAIVIDEGEIPREGNRDQFRCRNGKLVVDKGVKTPFMLRQERIQELEQELDEELGRSEPDIVQLLRLQREIERAKKGDS